MPFSLQPANFDTTDDVLSTDKIKHNTIQKPSTPTSKLFTKEDTSKLYKYFSPKSRKQSNHAAKIREELRKTVTTDRNSFLMQTTSDFKP